MAMLGLARAISPSHARSHGCIDELCMDRDAGEGNGEERGGGSGGGEGADGETTSKLWSPLLPSFRMFREAIERHREQKEVCGNYETTQMAHNINKLIW